MSQPMLKLPVRVIPARGDVGSLADGVVVVVVAVVLGAALVDVEVVDGVAAPTAGFGLVGDVGPPPTHNENEQTT